MAGKQQKPISRLYHRAERGDMGITRVHVTLARNSLGFQTLAEIAKREGTSISYVAQRLLENYQEPKASAKS